MAKLPFGYTVYPLFISVLIIQHKHILAHTRIYVHTYVMHGYGHGLFSNSRNKTNCMANKTQQSPDQMELSVKHPAGCEFPILYCHFILHT